MQIVVCIVRGELCKNCINVRRERGRRGRESWHVKVFMTISLVTLTISRIINSSVVLVLACQIYPADCRKLWAAVVRNIIARYWQDRPAMWNISLPPFCVSSHQYPSARPLPIVRLFLLSVSHPGFWAWIIVNLPLSLLSQSINILLRVVWGWGEESEGRKVRSVTPSQSRLSSPDRATSPT